MKNMQQSFMAKEKGEGKYVLFEGELELICESTATKKNREVVKFK